MELSVVRIQKAGASGGQPWVQARPVVHPDKYLSQCPFILLNEESYPPLSEFPVHAHRGVVAVTFAVDGSVEQTDSAGGRWHLRQGDAEFSMGGGGVMRGATRNDQGVKLLHLWINLPGTLKPGNAGHQVIRHEDAHRASFGDASALLYAGTLGKSSGPYTSPWPITVADLSLQAGKKASVPLASNERCFAYILSGDVELGRNQVQLNRGNVAWIERTVELANINLLTLRAAKETRILLFSSPVFGEDTPTLTTEPAPRRQPPPHMTDEART